MVLLDTVKSIPLRTYWFEKACDRFCIGIMDVSPTAVAGNKISTPSFNEKRACYINCYSLWDLIVSDDATKGMRQIMITL